MVKENDSIISRVMSEFSQGHPTRRHLYKCIDDELGVSVITFFTSFLHSNFINDSDADMLEGLLQAIDLSKGLAVIISSPGGSGEAAERIINIFRSYSGTGEFLAIVPGKAKSAATMICLGSSNIIMGSASELGPIDPQIPIIQDGMRWNVSAFHIVDTYETLFNDATSATGNLEPYLQQLGRYHASVVSHLNSAIELSKDISIKALKAGMMSSKSEEIEEAIQILLTPEDTKTHGRPIFRDAARTIGLNIDAIDHQSGLWKALYELYTRLKFLTEGPQCCKVIESKDSHYIVPVAEE